ncbi:ribose-5-phosphate isomerase RpiA [Candidatus Micrarchaeota archaeon]|nr:ribose-5-phosphate isomerase RpiA [Candidatus Micrarchaeota archaeon]
MDLKEQAAAEALKHVRNGMILGLGSGSTSAAFIRLLGQRVRARKLHIQGVPTSKASEKLAKKNGIPLLTLEQARRIDLAIDGADAVDSKLRLIKGGGGAHAREKVIDYAAKRFMVIVDETKMRSSLAGWVPLEILPFALPEISRLFSKQGVRLITRARKSDNGNVLADAFIRKIPNPSALEISLNQIPGMVENGIFSRNVSQVIVATSTGIRILRR